MATQGVPLGPSWSAQRVTGRACASVRSDSPRSWATSCFPDSNDGRTAVGGCGAHMGQLVGTDRDSVRLADARFVRAARPGSRDGVPDGLPSHAGAPVPLVLLADALRQLVAAFGFQRRGAAVTRLLGRLGVTALIKVVHHPHSDRDPRRCYHLRGYQLTGNGSRWLTSRSEALVTPSQLIDWFLARSEAAHAVAADGPPARAGGLLPMTESMWRG